LAQKAQSQVEVEEHADKAVVQAGVPGAANKRERGREREREGENRARSEGQNPLLEWCRNH